MSAVTFETRSDLVSGAVLIAHGLNNKPEVMNSLIEVLRAEGFHCLRISLRDGAVENASPAAIADGWLDIIESACGQLANRYPSLPIYNLSYSLGALTTIRFLDTHPAFKFKRMILIAPPVALTRSASLVRLLAPLSRFGLALPSAAPREVRARWATPLKEYAAMINITDRVQVLHNANELGTIPTEIVLDADDELVSYPGALRWLEVQGLDSWSSYRLPERHPQGRTYAHLMVLEKSLGTSTWLTLTDRIVKHFKSA